MQKLKNKTILVTGGAGFIGSNLCQRLIKEGNNNVICLDNLFTGTKKNYVDGVEYREGHTKDIEKHIPEKPDIIYHLGEYSRVEQSFNEVKTVWDLNKQGTFFVLEFCRKIGAKIVYAGSSTKFGDGGLGRSQSPYAWTKASNTELVRNYGNWFNIPYAITYFYNVYGPREIKTGKYATLIALFKEKIKNSKPLTVVSPGIQKRNFTHVEDIIDGIILVGENGFGDEFGIGHPDSYSIIDIAKMFSNNIVMLPERKGNRMMSEVHIEKIKKLGWKPKHDIREYIKNICGKIKK